MIEVFKTDVKSQTQADIVLFQLQKNFIGLESNFDLEDCDSILRIECKTQTIQTTSLLSFLKTLECNAEVLPDKVILKEW